MPRSRYRRMGVVPKNILPNGIRKHIRKLKAKIRREIMSPVEIKEKIKEIDLKFYKNVNPR